MSWPLDEDEDEDEDGEVVTPVQTASEEASAETKVCPDRTETIKAAANVCQYCGYRFAPPASARV